MFPEGRVQTCSKYRPRLCTTGFRVREGVPGEAPAGAGRGPEGVPPLAPLGSGQNRYPPEQMPKTASRREGASDESGQS